MSIIEVDATTGETTTRPLTAEEQVDLDTRIALAQAEATATATATATRNAAKVLVIQTAQTAVGVRFDLLTASQVRALMAILLWQGGALDGNGIVQPLNQWVR